MKNLDEYVSRYKQFKNGNYEYNSITSLHTLRESIEKGRRIVFIGGHVNTTPFFLIGFIVLPYSFVLSTQISFITFETYSFLSFILIFLEISSIPCGIFFGLGLWYKRSRYIIVGPEGIAYKMRTQRIRGYNWEEIQMNYFLNKIYLSMSNGDNLKIEASNFSCKEISQNKSFVSKATLLMYIFFAYYDYRKTGIFNWQPQAVNNAIDSDIVIIDTWKDQLKATLEEYKKKNYNFGNYTTNIQLQNDFLKKKIFVLKGGFDIGIWLLLLVIWSIPVIIISLLNPFYGLFNISEYLYFLLIWYFVGSPFFLVLRRFLVISTSGVYYRFFGKKSYFSWDEVVKIKRSTQSGYPNDLAVVDVFLLNKRIRFRSNLYKNREFPRNYANMFLNLFTLNAKLHNFY
ncbi:MAG: hypothetical protein ACFE9I_06010 [Candidatus Hermodarchaeota archaeon]